MNRKRRISEIVPTWRESRKCWQIDIPESLGGGRRRRYSFPDRESAERWIAERALESIGGNPVLDHRSLIGPTVEEIARLFISSKTGLGQESLRILRVRLGHLLREFGRIPARDLQPLRCKWWLASLPVSQRSRFAIFSEARSLFRWSVRYDILQTNPFERMEPESRGRGNRSILTPHQMALLLAMESPDWFRAWLVLGGFAGLRSVEVERLDWSAVRFSDRTVFVGEHAIKKTRGLRCRYVQLLPAALRHLPRGQSGPIVPVVKNAFAYWRKKAAVVLGLSVWPHNSLRHSFASYHLAESRDASQTAHEMGHTSAQMVHGCYAEAVTPASARRWWSL